ncbi:MAG: GEVED domain-containing protein, partial [Pirellulaceae bacterium]
MARRRFASSRIPKRSRLRDQIRLNRRRLIHESLERRELLAGPELLAIRPDASALLQEDDTLNVAPREFNLLFTGGADIAESTIDNNSIRLIRSGGDGGFDDGNEVNVELGFVGFVDPGDTDPANLQRIVVRPASSAAHNATDPAFSFPDDTYQIQIIGAGGSALTNLDGEAFNDGADFEQTFRLDRGGQVVATVPQPVSRNTQQIELISSPTGTYALTFQGETTDPLAADATGAEVEAALQDLDAIRPRDISVSSDLKVTFQGHFAGEQVPLLIADNSGIASGEISVARTGALTQASNQIVLYLDDQMLDPDDATDPQFFRLVNTNATLVLSDDQTLLPELVTYDPEDSSIVLTFADPIPEGNYRLDVGQSDGEDGTRSTAINVGTLFSSTPFNENRFTYNGVLGDVGGSHNDASDQDLFEVQLKAGSALAVRLTPHESQLDLDVRLLDSAGAEVGSATVTPGGPGAMDMLTLDPVPADGAYFVEVASADGTGSYSLDISVTGNPLPGSDNNTTIDDATDLGILGAAGVSFTAQIQPQGIAMPPYPGGNDEPGHRQIQAESHIGSSGTTPSLPGLITQRSYYFPDTLGTDPSGNPYQNLITEEEKQIVRSIFEIYASASDYEFVETSGSGTRIGKGDLRAIDPTLGPDSGVAGKAGASFVLLNGALYDQANREYGDGFTGTMFHEIGHSLGLGHSYELPSVQGDGVLNDVLPGDHDIVHLQRIHRPDSNDIDLHRFEVIERGRFTAETIAERMSDQGQQSSLLNTALQLYRQTASGDVELIASNDNYYGNDSFIDIALDPGTYFIGVSSTGNTDYDPRVKNSGFGGTTGGQYDLKLAFEADRDGALVDTDGTAFDGDVDGRPGGVYQFWFQASDSTIFVDKLNDLTANVIDGDGSLDAPYDTVGFALRRAGNRIVLPVDAIDSINDGDEFTIKEGSDSVTFQFDKAGGVTGGYEVDIESATTPEEIADAIEAAIAAAKADGALSASVAAIVTGRVVQMENIDHLDVTHAPALLAVPNLVHIVGNAGADHDLGTLADNKPYLIGIDRSGDPLADGAEFLVPQGVTTMVAAGTLFKMRKANLDAGTSSANISRSHSVIQLLGTPNDPVFMRSYHNDQVGGNSDGVGPAPRSGDFGGVVFREDSDLESEGVFLNYVNHADINNGGGKVFVDSQELVFTPIHVIDSRPSATFNHISNSADAAMSANPDSFNDALGRIGPDIQGNFLSSNTIDGLFIRIETGLGSRVEKLTVPGRFDDADIAHVITENLQIEGNPGGPIVQSGQRVARAAGRLLVDPGVVLKFSGSRIEAERGSSSLIAEGTPNRPIIFTSLSDDRFGGSGAFDTNDNGFMLGQAGDWSGIMLNHTSSASIDHAVISFGGGDSPTEGGSVNFNAIEVHQAHLRLTNSLLQNNANGNGTGTRDGRGNNQSATIYVRGSQPVVVNNIFEENAGPVLNLNANSLRFENMRDPGRSTGSVDVFSQFADNHGPLVRLNRLGDNGINGMLIRGEELTTESIWDDTDIVHVLTSEIVVGNHHTYSGLRLQSSNTESLVVKLSGGNAGLTATGKPLDIHDRIGGTVQILGTVGHPVVMTDLADDEVGAGLTPEGKIALDTNGNGNGGQGSSGSWRGLRFDEFSNDRNVAIVRELESPLTHGNDVNRTTSTSQFLGTLAPDQKSGDENRRLGFEVKGFVSPNDSRDVDVYSFRGTAGTEVWLDADRTDPSLDLIIEVINAQGTVLARSVSNTSANNLNAFLLQKEPRLGGDFYSQNFRDPGFRYTLPGTTGVAGIYFVRVRSNPASAASVASTAGESRGEYQLQVRQQQVDEFPGSTVQYADIRFAQTGIDVRGLPAHSPLIAEAGELDNVGNNSQGGAEQLVNLLQTDMAALGIAGELQNATDVDWYQFNLDHSEIQFIPGVNDGAGTVSLVFDLDYSDGAVRGDTTLAVYDANQKLIFIGRESNVEDDQSGAGQGSDIDDLSRGSLGKKDAFIGPVHLPVGYENGGAGAGSDELTYYVAVMSNQRLPSQAAQTLLAYPVTNTPPDPTDPTDPTDRMAQLTRLEPINSLRRVVEDHIGFQGYRSRDVQINPQVGAGIFDISSRIELENHVRPFSLRDVVLYAATDPSGDNGDNLYTANPFAGGNYLTRVAQHLVDDNDDIQDIVMRSDGRMFGFQRLDDNAGQVGALVEINPSTGAIISRQNANIPDRSPTPNVSDLNANLGSRPVRAEQFTTSDEVDALTFQRLRTVGSGNDKAPEYDLYYVVRESDNSSKLYRARPNGDASPAIASDGNQRYGVMGDIQPAGVTHASTSLTVADNSNPQNRTNIRLESKLPGGPGNSIRINITRPNNNNARVTDVSGNTINLEIGATGGDRNPDPGDPIVPPTNGPSAQAIVDAINNHDKARQLVTAVIVGGNNNDDGDDGTAAASISSSTGPTMDDFDGGSVPLEGGAGTPLNGRVTGLSFGNYLSNGNLFGVTSAGELLEISKDSGLVVRQIDLSTALPADANNFQGLALGPQNVEDGDYATTLFAIANNGSLAALDPSKISSGDPAQVLRTIFDSTGDGVANANSVQVTDRDPNSTNISESTVGLAFSPLDFNLWHPTMRRATNAGHGINGAPDDSRVPGSEDADIELVDPNDVNSLIDSRNANQGQGGASFHFGFEQYEDNPNANTQSYLTYEAGQSQLGILNEAQHIDLSSNPAIIDPDDTPSRPATYNLPGGALGSLQSSGFSLAGYDIDDVPTLYFNYFLETENHGGSTANSDGGNPFRDSARVFASRNNGASWELLATNNSQLSAGDTAGVNAELPGFLSHLSDAGRNSSSPRLKSHQIVQELFDNTGEWRQARVDLSPFAGASDIQLRFDFSTAGAMGDSSLGSTDSNFGELTHATRSVRSEDNKHEGFYIDDIIVGFAERGEMVTGPNAPSVAQTTDLATIARVNRERDPDHNPEILNGRYQLEVRRAGEYASVNGDGEVTIGSIFDTNRRHIVDSTDPANTGLLGDRNRERPQGVFVIDSNFIRDSSVRGINVDVGTDEAGGNVPHPGSTINFPQTDQTRLVPGVVIQNNVIADSSGVRFAGHDSTAPQTAVPFGKIVNNTFVGNGGTGVQVGANASPTIMNNLFAFHGTAIADAGVGTVIRSNFFQQNGDNTPSGTDAIVVAGSPDLFVDAANGNYYLAPDSLAVDSSLNTLQDRFNYANFKNALGIPPSPLVAPDRDVFGQLRVDSGTSAGGGGSSVFKDRGAIDRADFDAPFAELIVPVDNDAADSDPNRTIVWQKDPFLEGFAILLSDGPGPNAPFEGTGVDSLTVDDPTNDAISQQAVTITQNGQPLTEGVDYELGYNSLTGVLSLTPLATLWQPQSVYDITLDNTLITDLAGNALRSNRADGSTRFTILLGDFDFDFGDAPDSFGTLLASNGARHILTDPHEVILGRLIDAEEGLVAASDDATPVMAITETGDSFTVDINGPATAATVTVEEDDIATGDTLTLTFGSEVTVFELSLDGTVTTSGATAIEYSVGDSAASIASTLAAAISDVLGDAGLAEVSADQPDEVKIDVNDDDGVPVGAFGPATGLILERGTGPVTSDPDDVVGFLNPRDQDFGTVFSIDVTGSGLLDAWVDFNNNGIFTDPGEQILDDHPVVDGVNEIPVFAPPGTSNGLKHARFRVSTAGVLEPTGLALDGEVEDYQLLVANVNLPVPQDASYAIDEDNEISATLPDPTIPLEPTIDPASLRYEMIVPPQFDPGFALADDGTLTYDPEADFYGTDTFTYRVVGEAVVDGDTLPVRSTAIATATITVAPINDPPTAESHAFKMIEPIDSSGTTTITMSEADLLAGALVHPDTDARDAPWSEEEQSLKVVQIQVRDIDGNFTSVLTEADGTPLADPFLPIDDVYTVDTYINGIVSGSLTITVAGNAVTEVIYQPSDHYNEDNPRTAGGSPSLDGFIYTVADDGATTLPD